ncbi:MAG TPA: tetratricopeptide repeat protein [Bryobacteraceae bacterium]|nr:tetratricopeptide repeat protein [Bryobacteraceae bacterium]
MQLARLVLGAMYVASVPAATYSDSKACDVCHADVARRYGQSSMANSIRPTEGATPLEDDAVFDHEPSRKRYVLSRTYQRRTTPAGDDAFHRAATHTIGSGKNARSYLHRSADGELTQLPLSWYTQEKRWGMSPGYDAPNHPDFARTVEPGCLFCHTSYPLSGAAAPTLQSGIDCQRCHGPGSDHVSKPAKRNIVRDGGIDVCLQCHLQSTSDPLPHAVLRFGRGVYSYRPGEKLGEYAVHFDYPSEVRSNKFEINSHGYRLLQSACFIKSAAKVQCVSCHNPHGEVTATAVRDRTRTACLGCHAPHRDERGADCASCHMPRSRAQDAVHVTMTDHRIMRQARSGATEPLPERHDVHAGAIALMFPNELPASLHSLYLGFAYLQGRADTQAGLHLLSGTRNLPGEVVAEVAKALADLGQIDAAARKIEAVQAVLSRTDHLAFGQLLLRAGRMQGAKAHLEQALPAGEAHMGLASIALKEGRSAEAAEHWRRAAHHARVRTDALANVGALYLESGDLARAFTAASESVAFEPNGAEGNTVLSRVFAARGEFDKATDRVRRAISLDPKHAEARYHYGRLLHRAGRRNEAVSEYRETLGLQPRLYGAHLSLGVAYAEAGAYSRAAEHFRAALALKPDLHEAKQNLQLMERRLLETSTTPAAVP